jgi:hypothetical protein
VLYGARSQTLLDFGITPAKVPVRTAASKVAAAAKGAATRLARHTMGTKQKAAIHGTVAPAAPVPPAAPAPAAPAQASPAAPQPVVPANGTAGKG